MTAEVSLLRRENDESFSLLFSGRCEADSLWLALAEHLFEQLVARGD